MKQIVRTLLLVSVMGAVAGAQAPPPAPSLSPSEQAAIERVNLLAKIAQLEQQVSQLKVELGKALEIAKTVVEGNVQKALEAEVARIKSEVEQANPGYTWDPASGVFTPKKPE